MAAPPSALTAASDGGFAGRVADMGVAVGSTFPLSFTFAETSSGGNAKTYAVTYLDGYACIPAAAFVFALLAAVLFGRLEFDMVVGNECGTCFAWNIRSCDVDIGLFTCTSGNKGSFAACLNLTRLGLICLNLGGLPVLLFAVGYGDADLFGIGCAIG